MCSLLEQPLYALLESIDHSSQIIAGANFSDIEATKV